MDTSGTCTSSFDCANTHFCWPSKPNSTVTECLEMFSQNNYKIFGMLYDKDKTLLENSLSAGQYCKSGIAAISTNKTFATCVEIAYISTNINGSVESTAPEPSPYKCSLVDESP